jgi:prephenate dehydrogenase
VAVLGLGLLGGSVAAAARARGAAREVVGYARQRAPLERALARGVVDRIVDGRGGAARAVAGADLVVLATPVSGMARVLEQAAPSLREGALVTDVGSVKGPLLDTLPGLLPSGAAFIGSHPMAGSHETGVDHARADLLEGACCVVTPGADADPAKVDLLCAFWAALGARVVRRDAEAHDVEVGWVSHLPHLIAFAYARALAEAPDAAGELAGTGFADFVRIARSDSELWGEILGQNHKALAGPLEAFSRAVAELTRAVEAGDPAGVADRERLLEAATRRLDALAPAPRPPQTPAPRASGPRDPEDIDSARSGGQNPEIQAAPERTGEAATRKVPKA